MGLTLWHASTHTTQHNRTQKSTKIDASIESGVVRWSLAGWLAGDCGGGDFTFVVLLLWRGQIFVYALRGVDHVAFVHR